jgi:hypothetical protein
MDSKVDKCRKTMINDDKCSILTLLSWHQPYPLLEFWCFCSWASEHVDSDPTYQSIRKKVIRCVSMEIVWQVFLQSEVASSLPRKAQKGCAPTCLLWRRAGWGCTPLKQQLVQQKMWSSNIGNAWKCSNDIMRETQCHHKPTIWGW